MKKQRNILKKSNENLQKRRFLPYFRHFLPEKNFFLKNLTRILSKVLIRIFVQKNQKKLMTQMLQRSLQTSQILISTVTRAKNINKVRGQIYQNKISIWPRLPALNLRSRDAMRFFRPMTALFTRAFQENIE